MQINPAIISTWMSTYRREYNGIEAQREYSSNLESNWLSDSFIFISSLTSTQRNNNDTVIIRRNVIARIKISLLKTNARKMAESAASPGNVHTNSPQQQQQQQQQQPQQQQQSQQQQQQQQQQTQQPPDISSSQLTSPPITGTGMTVNKKNHLRFFLAFYFFINKLWRIEKFNFNLH